MNFIHDPQEAAMDAVARAHTRIPLSPNQLLDSVPDLIGDGAGSLAIRRSSKTPAGPPAGSYRLPARWSSGRTSGTAQVLVMPLWRWGGEVHLTLGRPARLSRLVWTRRRLDRLAGRLTVALSEAVARRAGVGPALSGTGVEASARRTATTRRPLRSATSISASR